MEKMTALFLAVLLLRGGAAGSATVGATEGPQKVSSPPPPQKVSSPPMPAVGAGSARLVLGPPVDVRPEGKATPPVSAPKKSSKKTRLAICLAAIFGPPVVVTCVYNIYTILKERFPETITYELSGGGRSKKYITGAIVLSYILVTGLAVYQLIVDAV